MIRLCSTAVGNVMRRFFTVCFWSFILCGVLVAAPTFASDETRPFFFGSVRNVYKNLVSTNVSTSENEVEYQSVNNASVPHSRVKQSNELNGFSFQSRRERNVAFDLAVSKNNGVVDTSNVHMGLAVYIDDARLRVFGTDTETKHPDLGDLDMSSFNVTYETNYNGANNFIYSVGILNKHPHIRDGLSQASVIYRRDFNDEEIDYVVNFGLFRSIGSRTVGSISNTWWNNAIHSGGHYTKKFHQYHFGVNWNAQINDASSSPDHFQVGLFSVYTATLYEVTGSLSYVLREGISDANTKRSDTTGPQFTMTYARDLGDDWFLNFSASRSLINQDFTNISSGTVVVQDTAKTDFAISFVKSF